MAAGLDVESVVMCAAEFQTHFSAVSEPRMERCRRYPLCEILFLSACAMLAGADGPTDIERFGKDKISWLRKFYPFANGIPSHDTISRVFMLMKPSQFQECFLAWTQTVRDAKESSKAGQVDQDSITLGKDIPEDKHICIDGKTLRGSGDERQPPLHLVSAWYREGGLSLGQEATDAKSNEITAIPKLLDTLELQGATVTIDAMGCQRDIAAKIIDQGGQYILAVKDNQPKLHEAIVDYFVKAHEEESTECRRCQTTAKEHGCQVDRYYTVAPLSESMKSFRSSWKDLKGVGQAITITRSADKETCETRYYIISESPKVKTFAEHVRGHWSIENSLHWSLDVTFREDASQIRIGHGPANFGFLRRFAVSVLKQDTSKGSLRGKRKSAAWNTEFLEKLLGLR